MTKLYAWATPAFVTGSPVDHTWVTTYDNQEYQYGSVTDVASAEEHYWFCWGSFHKTGGTPGNPTGFLGQQSANLALARCLVKSNADSRLDPDARGTIFVYGTDGVCHQLANQVLYATVGIKLTVKGARGYLASNFLYGTYGAQDAAWASRLQACSASVAATGANIFSTGGSMQNDPDDFEERARAVLGEEDPELLERLLCLRIAVRVFVQQRQATPLTLDSATINAQNQALIDQAAQLLGPERFEEVFGFPAGEKINLVDPAVMNQQIEME
jgi:hypothetical protein